MTIRAVPFMLKVRDYAHENKLPFFKWEDQNKAAQEYLRIKGIETIKNLQS